MHYYLGGFCAKRGDGRNFGGFICKVGLKFMRAYLQNGTEILRLGFHSPLVTIWMGVLCKKDHTLLRVLCANMGLKTLGAYLQIRPKNWGGVYVIED